MFALPEDYLERVYAGVLGKLVGVYLGRPFEGYSYQEIMKELGVIRYYVNDRMKVPYVVTDDDVSGTFVFVRALEEHGIQGISSEAIGKTWLNQVVEKKSVFWWGGRGISTEHTAYLNLKHGIPAPHSGSIQTNGKTIAEQIGAQIFIDGWALVSPGRPELAARLAEMGGKVSHDGESVYAAMLWAAMEAEAFVSKDVDHLLDTGLQYIPSDSLLARVIGEVRAWVKEDGEWLKTRQRIEDKYGYDKFCGSCHVIPNHCIMIMALLYAGHDFSLAMEIINTAGWDTDCNSGNLGCLVAIMHGMESFNCELDWRGPIEDRALISSADGGYSINNAARIAIDITNMGRKLAGKAAIPPPKNGAQFHFTLPGSTQGFRSTAPMYQVDGKGLCVELDGPVEVTTPTHAPKEYLDMLPVYPLMSSPLVYPGQTVTVDCASDTEVDLRIRIKAFNSKNELVSIDGDVVTVKQQRRMEWTLPETPENYPIAELGLAITPRSRGKLFIDSVRWDGAPNLTLTVPAEPHTFWDLGFVQSVNDWKPWIGVMNVAQDKGEGIVSYGTREWTDYRVIARDFMVKLGSPAGVAIRVQGINRYYSLVFTKGGIAIVKAYDEQRIELVRKAFDWKLDEMYEVTLEAEGSKIRGKVGDAVIEATDHRFVDGAMGLVVTDGAVSARSIQIQPL